MKKILLTGLLCIAIAITASGQKLDKFGSDLAKKTIMGKEIRMPYTDLTSYYGYIKPGSKPDEVKAGKKMYYIYVWIPIISPEIGIRMISPVPDNMSPKDKDYQSAEYMANKSDNSSYFDTWITFERASGIMKIDDITAKVKTATWTKIDSNDDSSDMPEQPSGNKYNSLMRMVADISNPSKALVVGLYRIGFTTYKTGEVKGGFLAQLGSPIKLPGVLVAVKPEGIVANKK